ncbi:MAG: response regulator transcription factor [Armatimonadetes bacterium]|nr:response regulator transcription factor [Armatimonadota bacterium]
MKPGNGTTRWTGHGLDGGPRVLVVEDEPTVAAAVREGLGSAGFVVWVAGTGTEALSLWQRLHPDAIVLDLFLPDMDGFDVCKAIRRDDVVPLILTSRRRTEVDRVCGLELGADDYICKPYEVEELAARLRALLIRCRRYAGRQREEDHISAGALTMDRIRHEALLAGRKLDLTPKEFELLWALAKEAGRTVPARQLLWEVWGYDESIHTRTLDVHIGRLRRKLGDSAASPAMIVTVPSVGYRFETSARPASQISEEKRGRPDPLSPMPSGEQRPPREAVAAPTSSSHPSVQQKRSAGQYKRAA